MIIIPGRMVVVSATGVEGVETNGEVVMVTDSFCIVGVVAVATVCVVKCCPLHSGSLNDSITMSHPRSTLSNIPLRATDAPVSIQCIM